MLSTRKNWLSAAVVIALTVQASVLAHDVFAHHARCAEHGEWVDAESSEHPTPLSDTETFTHALASRLHIHCVIAAEHRRPHALTRPLMALRNLPPTGVTRPRPAPSAGATVPPIKVAPKQSPPLA